MCSIKKIDEDDIPPSVFWKCLVICLLCLLADSGLQTHIVLCFSFVCLRVMSPMLSVFLDCPFLIAPSVFCNVCVYLDTTSNKGTAFLCCSAYFVILFHQQSCISRFSINTVYLKCVNLWRYIFKVWRKNLCVFCICFFYVYVIAYLVFVQ